MNLGLHSISLTYPDGFPAIRDASATIGGGVFGLLGPNGAGKTSLMEILAGQLVGFIGDASIEGGASLRRDPVAWRTMLGYVPQRFDFPGQMTGWELIRETALLRGLNPRATQTRAAELLEMANLLSPADRYAASYSRGMKQRLGIVLAILHEPPLLLLDEPTAGLDPVERQIFRELLLAVGRDRIVILSTHIVGDVARCCESLGVFVAGRFLFTGSGNELGEEARGLVWEMPISGQDAATLTATRRVVALMTRDGEPWARLLAAEQPSPEAVAVQPELHDGYVTVAEEAAMGREPRMSAIYARPRLRNG